MEVGALVIIAGEQTTKVEEMSLILGSDGGDVIRSYADRSRCTSWNIAKVATY